ncbi:MAG: hypothetical protein M3546_14150 [Actinomycetota bacterium]|nr:hypothetical protein [Actinomycetota bacterium]
MALASSVEEIAGRLSATELATGDGKTAKELRRAVEAVAKHDPKLEARLTDRIDVLMDRLGTLASAVSTTAAELARRDGEIATLRRELERGSARLESLGKDVSRSASATDVEKLREANAERPAEVPTRSGTERFDRVEGRLTLLAERIDTLSPTVAAAASGLAARDGELANLRQKLARSADHVEQVVAEMHADPRIAALATRVDMLASELEALTSRPAGMGGDMEALRARIDDGYAKASAAVSELQVSLSTVGSRLGAIESLPAQLEHALATQADNLDSRLETLFEASHATDARVSDLAATLSEQATTTTAAQAQRFDRLRAETGAQLAAVERGQAEIRAELDHRANELDSGRAALQAELRELTTTVARIERSSASEDTPSGLSSRIALLTGEVAAATERLASHEKDGDFERRLTVLAGASAERIEIFDDLTMRLAAVEQRRNAPADEIDRILDTWASDRSSLETRLDQLAAALAGTGPRGDIAESAQDEVIRMRVLVEELQMRISANEHQVTTLRSASPLPSRLDEIVDRLEAVERTTQGGVFAPSSGPVTGDGRFRLELRSLELRLEQAAASAQEEREVLLAQLERMASRLEWRLKRLEAKDAELAHDEPTLTGARVVPFRGAEV